MRPLYPKKYTVVRRTGHLEDGSWIVDTETLLYVNGLVAPTQSTLAGTYDKTDKSCDLYCERDQLLTSDVVGTNCCDRIIIGQDYYVVNGVTAYNGEVHVYNLIREQL